LGALSRPLTSPDAGAWAGEDADPTAATPATGGEISPGVGTWAGQEPDPTAATPATGAEISPDAGARAGEDADPTTAGPSNGGMPAPAPDEPAWGSARQLPLRIRLPNAFAAQPHDVALVVVHGLPHGASLSAGVASGDGSWLVSPRDLAGLSVAPPPGLTLDLALEAVAITVQNREGELTKASVTVHVPLQAAADDPARAAIPIRVDPQILGGSNATLDALVVRDLPAGARLSAGAYDPAIDGWVLLPRQLSELTVTPGIGQIEDFTLTLLGISLSQGRARSHFLGRVPVSVG
jgi:hypothetical protein